MAVVKLIVVVVVVVAAAMMMTSMKTLMMIAAATLTNGERLQSGAAMSSGREAAWSILGAC